MGSVGFGEIALIAIVALLVFGPDRLPEMAKKAGELLAKGREATRSFTDSIDREYDDSTAPIRTLRAEYEATLEELRNAAGTVLDMSVDGAEDEPVRSDTAGSDTPGTDLPEADPLDDTTATPRDEDLS